MTGELWFAYLVFGTEPAAAAVAYRGEPRWLDDAGGVHDYAEGAA